MFSASCSPVKISGSKQINAIFITICVSGTAISFGEMASPDAKGSFASQDAIYEGAWGVSIEHSLLCLQCKQFNELSGKYIIINTLIYESLLEVGC